MKKYVLVIFSLFMFIPIVNAEEKINVSLVNCVDGDTAVFKINNEEKKFRFLAIDTPETVHPTKGEESGGKLASIYTCELLTNASSIQILYDDKGSKTDKYGRELAWIYIDDILLQEKLVREGYAEIAYVYYKYSFVESLCDIQKNAIEEKIGIWADGTREVGYCKTKSNKSTTSKSTPNKTTTAKKGLSKNQEKIIDYIIDGKYESALKLMVKDTTSIIVLVILLIIFIIVKILKKKIK